MNIQIIADSCCDVTPAMRKLLDIQIASLTINVEDKVFVDDEQLDTTALLNAMKASKNAPSTACPSPDAYAQLMRSSEACFVVTLAGQLSGSYNAACVARDMVLEETPDKKIHVLQSNTATAGETLLARLLRDKIDAGLDFDTIAQQMDAFTEEITTLFVLESLDNLTKNGRISKFAGFMGTMLNLRPIMSADHGVIFPLEKVRGTSNAMKRLVEIVAEGTRDMAAASRTLVITYCNCAERVQALKEEFAAKCPAFKEIITLPTRGIATVYAYDGGVVLAY